MNEKFTIEVSYCLPEKQICVEAQLTEGCTVREAIELSGLAEKFGLQLEGEQATHVGIFGNKCSPDTFLRPGDRVEIYRPLLLSPTEARRLRAKLAAEKPSS